MAESMQNFAYHPSVASWVQSTALAQLDGHNDEAAEPPPDDFYDNNNKSTTPPTSHAHAHAHALPHPHPHPHPHVHPIDMTTTRQRQVTPNGAVRSVAKPSGRSASGSVTSTSSTPRSAPQLPANRPTVRSLAQKFNQPSSTDSSPLSNRARPVRAASTSTTKDTPSYGAYKFNNLKARERPQPAPPSPASARRANGARSSLPGQPSSRTPTRTSSKISSPTRDPARLPFFGEVVGGEHNASTPGFGIRNLTDSPTIKLITEDVQSLPDAASPDVPQPHNFPTQHQRSVSDMAPLSSEAGPGSPRRRSPPSRIPVRSRRMSASSTSSTSTRDSKFNGARPVEYRSSPTRIARVPVGRAGSITGGTSTHPTYRGYRERGKAALESSSGPSVSAVITAPPPQMSPRLRNSRERQLVQESPGAIPHYDGSDGYFERSSGDATPSTPNEMPQLNNRPSVKLVDASPDRIDSTATPLTPQIELTLNGQDFPENVPLSISTEALQAPPSVTSTSFELDESPILGIPGSFLTTPPLAQDTPLTNSNQFEGRSPSAPPQVELLSARAFEPTSLSQKRISRIISSSDLLTSSDFGSRESIPIMLGSEGTLNQSWDAIPEHPRHSPRLSISSQKWRTEHVDSNGAVTYIEGDDSPIDPYRQTLGPDDSASMAGYFRQRDERPMWNQNQPDPASFTLDSEAYSVINKVLNEYHASEVISSNMAQLSREQVMGVSPVVAQYADWGSKESTETYLARLLSDASSGKEIIPAAQVATTSPTQTTRKPIPNMSIRALDADPDEPVAGGTAIIFPTESKRYSRGSRMSQGSAATTIWEGQWEGQSRPDSSSGMSLRDRGLGVTLPGNQYNASRTNTPPRPPYSPPPPPGAAPNTFKFQGALDGFNSSLSKVMTSDNAMPQGKHPAVLQQEADMDAPAESPLPGPEPEPEQVILQQSTSAEEQSAIDAATRLVQKRYRVIEELTKTEHSFCVDMMVAHQIFENTAREVLTEQERRLLFGNCKDVEGFSHALWKSLKEAIKPVVNQTPPDEKSEEPYNEFLCCTPENDAKVRIGDIMLGATMKMERVYTTYYLNYSDASDFIKKNSDNAELLGWVSACFSHCPNLTTAWDLDSLLVKPCQRMLKYPILLDDLIAKTAPDHPDLPQLKKATATIKDIAARIEEAKSRQQTLRAATSEGKKKEKRGRFGNNIVKALMTKNDKAKNMQEAALVFEDKEYNQITQKFGGHFFQIQIVIRDFDQYLEAIEVQITQLNTMMLGFITVSDTGPTTNPEMESTWRRWAQAHLDIRSKALEDHKRNVRERVMKPISDVWDQWVQPQKLMEQRKKLLIFYVRYKQAVDRKEKVDSKLEDTARDFMTINDSLKLELPKLYEKTKQIIRLCEILFLGIQKDWYKMCSKKILPLLESEPQHTTSITYDFKVYVDRFKSDFGHMEDRAKGLAIINHELLTKIATYTTPSATLYSDDTSSRKSSSRRTESISSDFSQQVDPRNRSGEYALADQRNRNSGGYPSSRSSNMRSFEAPPRPFDPPPRSSPSAPYNPMATPATQRAERAISPSYSQSSDTTTITTSRARAPSGSAPRQQYPAWPSLDGAFDDGLYNSPPQVGATYLNPSNTTSLPLPTAFASPTLNSNPGSSRTSGVFNSALPMSDSTNPNTAVANIGGGILAADPPATPTDTEGDVEVLFLAASLFEFNIAHDRREGGIPYLVYVPGEIFDVIGMKGELWLARNQDDSSKTVGWIWEKHFARILPEEA